MASRSQPVAAVALALLLSFASMVTEVRAQKLTVDWKYFGGTPVDGGTRCFYDAKGVAQVSEGHLKVWTKCLLDKDIQNTNLTEEMINRAAQKIADYYLPPIGDVINLDQEHAATITIYEEIATNAYIETHDKMLYEFDCHEMMVRDLSTDFRIDGKHARSEKPGDWSHVPPEGNAASLSKILCPK